MSSLELSLTIVSFVMFGILCVVLIAAGEAINDYRAQLREARQKIAELTKDLEEIRRLYPLAEGRKLMKSPRWTEIEKAEEDKENE